MRFKTAFLISGFIATNIGVAQAAPVRKIAPKGAVSFTSKGQRFSIWLPVRPTQNKQIIAGEDGQSLTSFRYEARIQPVYYGVQSVDNPPNLAGISSKYLLDEMQNRMLKSPDEQLLRREDVRLGNALGRELEISLLKGKGFMRCRIYATPKTTYFVTAIATKATMQKQAAQIDRVFDSFRILPE